jgi:hypothetical protein
VTAPIETASCELDDDRTKTFLEVKNGTWVNVYHTLLFVTPLPGRDRLAAFFVSEASGYAHVWLAEQTNPETEAGMQCFRASTGAAAANPPPCPVRLGNTELLQVTSGEWVVSDHTLRVDSTTGALTFRGRKVAKGLILGVPLGVPLLRNQAPWRGFLLL